jgi:hypothetical protein
LCAATAAGEEITFLNGYIETIFRALCKFRNIDPNSGLDFFALQCTKTTSDVSASSPFLGVSSL